MMSAIKPRMTNKLSKPTGITMVKPRALPDGVQERIARKAYELWELRGRRHGYAVLDWLDAEMLVRDEIHEARE
jgi:hypothetical protein